MSNGKDMLIKAHSISYDDALFYLRIILHYNINKIVEEQSSSLKQKLDQITQQKGEEIMASLATRWLQEGRYEGEQEKARVIAKKMLAKGVKLQDISELTGLGVQEIQGLK